MNLTHYFKKQTEPKKQINTEYQNTKDTYLQIIKNLLNDNTIDAYTYNKIINFYKIRGNLLLLSSYNDIMGKIQNNDKVSQEIKTKLHQTSQKIFAHLYKITTTIIDPTIKFTDDQLNAIKNIIIFLSNKDDYTFRLNGFAGTGKTTTIAKLLIFLLSKRYIRSVVFVAPTNKAVNVQKSKFRTDIKSLIAEDNLSLNQQLDVLETKGITVHFLTIHKLLNYKNDFDADGSRIFVKNDKKSNIALYDLVVVDECSMVPFGINVNIFDSIETILRSAGKDKSDINKVPKVLFVGDPAQLPPVNESVSIIFSTTPADFDIELYKKEAPPENFDSFVKKVISQKTVTLEQVVRSNDDSVVGLCNEIRAWVLNKIPFPKMGQYAGGKVKMYKYDKTKTKTDTKWFNTCLNYFKQHETSNIILTWTNRQCDIYNTKLRQLLFNKEKLNTFEKGDILILNDFYNIKESIIETKAKGKQFYTSEQIKVVAVEETMKAVPEFSEALPKRISKIEGAAFVEDKFKKTIKAINKGITRKYDTWKLHVQKLNEITVKDSIPEVYHLYCVKDSHKNLLEKDKQFASEKIRELRKLFMTFMKDKLDILDKEVIRPLWREWNSRLWEPFADCNQGACQTVHKCQSSTYYNVFVDAHDILLNQNPNDAKRCLYTAFTRTSNELHVLL
jgi:hypothetical protein